MNAIHVRTQRGPSQPRTERVSLACFLLVEPRSAHKDVPEWVKQIPLPVIVDRLKRDKERRQPEAPQPELRIPLEEPRPRRDQRDEPEEPRSRVVIIAPDEDDSEGSGVNIIQL